MHALVEIGGVSLNVRSDVSGKPPLVLLHGLGSTHRIWELMTPCLSEYYDLYAFDQRGHGLSSKPTTGYTWDDLTNDLRKLLDVLGLPKVGLIGHSWGADVALEFAVRHPEKVRAVGLVDGATIDFQAHLNLQETEDLLKPQNVWGLTLNDLKQALSGWLTSLPDSVPQDIILANYGISEDGTVAPHLAYEANLEIARSMWQHRPPKLYEQLRVSALFVQALPPGELSANEKRYATWRSDGIESAATLVEDVQIVRLFETVHDVPLQRPHDLATLWREFDHP